MSTTPTTTTTTNANGSVINFTGLSSGVDTSAIVTELMRIEHLPIDNMTVQQAIEQARKDALTDISTKLKALKTASDAVNDQAFWAGTPHGTSGDPNSFTIDVSAGAPKATYQVQVKRLATGDVWGQQATAGVHTFSETYAGAGVLASTTTPLSTLTNAAGTSLGLVVGQTISLSGTQGGSPLTTTPYTITATSTLDDLKAFVQTQLPGSTVSIQTGGRIKITSPVGDDQDVIGARLTTSGPASAIFDGLFNAPVANTASSGVGKVLADDTLHVGAGGITFDVQVKAGWTMTQVATAINGANGGVTAGVTDGRLRISATETGATGGVVSITSTGTTAADMNLARQVRAADGIVTVDGVDVTTATNTTTSVIPGATVTLKKSMTTSETATTDPKWVDSVEAERRTKAFVDAYNTVLTTVHDSLTEKKVIPPKTASDRLKGVLFNSSTLTTVEDALRTAMGAPITGLAPGKNLGAFAGISTGAATSGGVSSNQDAIDGQLTFDATAFQAMFSTDRDGLRDILSKAGGTTATNGVAARIADLSAGFTTDTAYTTAAGTTQVVNGGGVIAAAIKGSTSAIKDFDDRIAAMTDRLALREQTLKAQFLAMETAISQLKSTQIQFPSLSSGNGSSGG